MDIWLVMGSALYWASVGVCCLGFVSDYPGGLGMWTPVAKYVFLIAVILFAYGTMCGLGVRRGCRVLAVAVLVASIASGIVTANGGWGDARLLGMALEFFVMGVFMILWGLAFATIEKRRAAQNVIATISLAVLILIGAFAVTKWVHPSQLAYGCFATSAIIMIVGRVPCASHRREAVKGQRAHKAASVTQRLLFGMVLGFCSEVARYLEPSEPGAAFMILAAVVLVASFVLSVCSSDGLYTTLPALLLVAVGALYLPFFEGGLPSAVWASAGIVWIAWSSFSAVQLSDLKERYGMSELDVCLADKILLAFGFVAGGGLWSGLTMTSGGAAFGHIGELCVFAATMALVLGSAYAMARLVGARQEDAARDELARTREERLGAVYAQIAGEFGFSRREREVMEMLAKGYTGVYICEELGVSTGTVKAHTAHIYQKLGIHRKDELLELIDERMANA